MLSVDPFNRIGGSSRRKFSFFATVFPSFSCSRLMRRVPWSMKYARVEPEVVISTFLEIPNLSSCLSTKELAVPKLVARYGNAENCCSVILERMSG